MTARTRGALPWRTLETTLVVLAAFATGCARHVSGAECTALLDRYVELLVKDERPLATEAEVRSAQERSRAKARQEPSMATCPEHVTESMHRCALDAPNVDEFEKCLE